MQSGRVSLGIGVHSRERALEQRLLTAEKSL